MMAQRLSVASNAIGLAKSGIDFVPASGTLMKLGLDMYNWVIREGLDEGVFSKCRELSLGLAYPNSEGQEIQRKLEKSDRKLSEMKLKAPLKLITSGALGRLLTRDLETCYIVSTVAAITKYHPPDYAADLLCSMILNPGGQQSGSVKRHDMHRAPLRAVISRMVNSVYLNVVNAGHDLGDLPTELKNLPQALLDDCLLASIVMRIRNEDQDMVIKSRRLVVDLTLWLLLHFDGQIQVSVGNAIVYTKKLGTTKRLIKLMVRKPDPEDREDFPSLSRAKECSIQV